MVNRPKDIGTRAETAIVRHARPRGFPDARRVAQTGRADTGDAWLCRGVIVESKAGAVARAASPALVAHWAAETEAERENAGAEIGLLVVQRLNRSVPGPGGWGAYLPTWAVVALTSDRDHALDMLDEATVRVGQTLLGMTLDEALHMLRWAGYGEPLADHLMAEAVAP